MEPVPNAIIHQRNRVGRFVCFRLPLSNHFLKVANCCVRPPLKPYLFVLKRMHCQFAPLRFDACKSLPSMENTNGLLPSRSGTSRCFSHRITLSTASICSKGWSGKGLLQTGAFSSHFLKAANCCVRSPLEIYDFVMTR